MLINESLMSKIGIMAILTFGAKFVRLVIFMITARFLTPEDFGVIATYTMIMAFAYLSSQLGLIRTLIQRPKLNSAHIGGAITLSSFLCMIVSSILFFGSEFISDFVDVEQVNIPLKVSSAMFVIISFSNVCSAIYLRNGDAVFIGKIQMMVSMSCNIILVIPLLYLHMGYLSIIISLIISQIFSSIIILYYGRGFLKFVIKKNESIEIVQYTSAFMVNNLLEISYKQIDIVIIGRAFGISALGNYTRSIQLVNFPSQIYQLVVDKVVFPAMSEMKNSKDELHSLFMEIFSALFFVLCFGALAIHFGSKEIVLVLMGSDWPIVITLLSILAISLPFRCLSTFIDSFLAASGHFTILNIHQLISLLVLIASIFSAIDFGLEAVIVAIVFSVIFKFLTTIFITVYFVKVPLILFFRSMLPGFLSSIIIIIIYWSLAYFDMKFGLLNIFSSFFLYFTFSILYPVKMLLPSILFFYIGKLKLFFKFFPEIKN